MDIIDRSTIEALIEEDRSPCVSIYLPTHRVGPEIQQDPIRLKNLLDEAQERLEGIGVRPPEASQILSEARAVLTDGSFWQHQERGLAVFVTPAATRMFRVPVTFDERVVVCDRFHLKPLWPAVAWGRRFAVLAVSENRVRLLSGTRDEVTEIDVGGEIPGSLAEALWYDDPERQLQHRATGRAGQGRVVATFHGHGVASDRDTDRLVAFLRAVDRGVLHLISPDVPLVLAGAERPVAFYRDVTEHALILDDHVQGNPDELAPSQLHHRAWEIVEPFFGRERQRDVDRLVAGGDLLRSTVESTVEASLEGRVDLLFAPVSLQVWGVAEPGDVTVHDERMPGDRDLIDAAVVETWAHGGKVYVVASEEIPGPGPVAALLRF